jgi:hypothetical protein
MTQLIPLKTAGNYVVCERRPKPVGVTKYCVFHGDTWLKDFARFGKARRWSKRMRDNQQPQEKTT